MAILLLSGDLSHKANRAYYVTCCREGCEARLLFSSRWSWIHLEHSFGLNLGKRKLFDCWPSGLDKPCHLSQVMEVYQHLYLWSLVPKAEDIPPWLVDSEVRSASFLFLPGSCFSFPSRSMFSLLLWYRTRVYPVNCFVELHKYSTNFHLSKAETRAVGQNAAWCLASQGKKGARRISVLQAPASSVTLCKARRCTSDLLLFLV